MEICAELNGGYSLQPSVVPTDHKTVDGNFTARDCAECGHNSSETWRTVRSQAKFGRELRAIIRRMPLRFAYYAGTTLFRFC
jgi:hypothetical protein